MEILRSIRMGQNCLLTNGPSKASARVIILRFSTSVHAHGGELDLHGFYIQGPWKHFSSLKKGFMMSFPSLRVEALQRAGVRTGIQNPQEKILDSRLRRNDNVKHNDLIGPIFKELN